MEKLLFSFLAVWSLISSAECRHPGLRYITTGPENEAVLVGNEAKFVCTSNLSAGVDWTVTPVGQTAVTVVRGCVLNPSYVGIYDVQNTGLGSCNIVVISATVNEAGTYLCQESSGFDPPQSAQLVLLESDPECSILINGLNASEVVEDDIVRLTCTAQYTTNLSPLSTEWTDSRSQSVWDSEWTSNGQFYSYIEFPAVVPSVDPYVAFTFFAAPVNPPTSAKNAPSYTYNWTSPALHVLYCPSNLTVVSSSELPGEDYAAGDNLTCFSNGSPSPSYFWIDLETEARTDGQSIIIASPGDFRFVCSAYNYIRGQQCNASIEVNGTATAAKVVPSNTALLVGTNGTMYCKFGSKSLSWVFTGTGQPGVVVAPDCVVLPSLTDVYAVNREAGACHLLINKAARGVSGIYTCQETDSPNKPPTAQLTILDSDPVCGDDLTDGIAVAEQRIHFVCRMNFTGNLAPTMTWTTASGQVISNATNQTTNAEVQFSIDMPIYPEVLQSFFCRTYFPTPTIPNSPVSAPAKNAPDYEYNWNSTERIVHYCPTEVTVSSLARPVFVGDVLNCSANGYPPPSYRWTNLQTNASIDGPSLLVTSDDDRLNYRCTAYNTIKNTSCSIDTTIDVQVYGLISPGNVAAETGSNFTLPCRHKHPGSLWLFTEFKSTSSVSIATSCHVLPAYADKYAVDTSDYRCDLILKSVSASEAGTYTCQDAFDLDLPPSCIVVVLDSAPDCFVNLTGGCETRLSCSVNYTGQLAPLMNWTDHLGQPVDSATYVAAANYVSSYIDVSGEGSSLPVLESFDCRTYFTEPPSSSFPPDGQTNPATNAPGYIDIWDSPTILFNETGSSESCPTLIQQNVDKSDAYFFSRNYNSFRYEFGMLDQNSSYWIGLDRLASLTSVGNCSLHVDLLEVNTNRWYSAEYSDFVVQGSSYGYRLYVSGYSGNAGDALSYHNGYSFSTYDYGNYSGCAQSYNGGFWYSGCYKAGINTSPYYNFYWVSNPSYHIYLETSRMWLFCPS